LQVVRHRQVLAEQFVLLADGRVGVAITVRRMAKDGDGALGIDQRGDADLEIAANRVYRFDSYRFDSLEPQVLTKVQMPCVIVATPALPEEVAEVVNARDDLGRPVAVVVVAQQAPHLTVPPGQYTVAQSVKLWRERIFRAVRCQRLPAVPDVWTVKAAPGPVLEWTREGTQLIFSGVTFRPWNRDYRGV
jgi:hypothetical protein